MKPHSNLFPDRQDRHYWTFAAVLLAALLLLSQIGSSLTKEKPLKAEQIAEETEISAVQMMADGRTLAAGHRSNGHDEDFVLLRYTSDNKLDPEFGANGVVTTDFHGLSDDPRSIVFRKDNRILIRGESCDPDSEECVLVLAQYLPTGQLDKTFGLEGQLITKVHGSSAPKTPYFREASDGELEVGASFCNLGHDCVSQSAYYAPDGSFLRFVEDIPTRNLFSLKMRIYANPVPFMTETQTLSRKGKK